MSKIFIPKDYINWLGPIRNCKLRTLKIRQPKLQRTSKTIIAMLKYNKIIGQIKTTNKQEADRIINADCLSFKIGWDHNRNEKILVDVA